MPKKSTNLQINMHTTNLSPKPIICRKNHVISRKCHKSPGSATTPRNLTLILLQNGKTLEVLDLSRGYGLRPEWIELITRHCINLKEANFNYYGLKEDSINYLVKNLTTKIERLCLSCAPLKVINNRILL